MSAVEQLELILYAALAEPIGLLISTDDPERAKQALYRARAKLGDDALARLQIRVLANGQLAIVKGSADGL